MANSQIPNLPGVAAVSGADLFEAVQGGVSVKETAAQIAAYTISVYPYPLPAVVNSWSGGATGLTPNIATTGNVVLGGTLNVPSGGTGVSSVTQYALVLGNGVSAFQETSVGGTGQVLVGNTGAAPTWATIASSLVSSISFGTTGLTPSSPTTGAVVVAGTLSIANGGTGQVTQSAAFNALSPITTAGDLIVGTGVNTAARLALGANGTFLFSNGTSPSWASLAAAAVTTISFGTTGLTPSSPTAGAVVVAGTLVAANGGTGLNTYVIGDLIYASATTTLSRLAGVATGNVLLSGGVGTAPSWGKVSLTAAVSGILPVANGGIGVGTLTGIPLGNGTSAFTVATAGTDYVAPTVATNFTAKQTFAGSSSTLAMVLANAAETTTISATAATGTINYDVTTQSVLYYTLNAAANWTLNVRASSGTSLNTAMSTGQTVTVVFLVTQGGTAFYNNAFQVDGNSVTPKWQGGSAPTAGNINAVDSYVYSIVKTGSAAFTVFASQTKFA